MSTSRAIRVLAEFAASDAVARGSGPRLQAALRDAIEVISAWRGPPAERARPHLERMRELLDRSGLDGGLRPLAASVLEALGFAAGHGADGGNRIPSSRRSHGERPGEAGPDLEQAVRPHSSHSQAGVERESLPDPPDGADEP